MITMQESQRSAAKDIISTKADLLSKQRDEFHQQIRDYNEEQQRKLQMADEMREAAGEDEMDLANEMAEVIELEYI